MDVLNIPGSTKQKVLPFVLDPNKYKNFNLGDSCDQAPVPQVFSFRGEEGTPSVESKSCIKGSRARISVCPASIYSMASRLVKGDVSFASLCGNGKDLAGNITVESLFAGMPCVQLREYTLDSKLAQFVRFLMNFGMNAFQEAFKLAAKVLVSGLTGAWQGFRSGSGQGWNSHEGFSAAVAAVAGGVMGAAVESTVNAANAAITGLEQNVIRRADQMVDWFVRDNSIPKAAPAWCQKLFKFVGGRDSDVNKLLAFPFYVYYLLQAQTTTNVYEVPCTPENLFNMNGQAGWGDGQMGVTHSWLEKLGQNGVSAYMKSLFNHVQVNYLQSWDAAAGAKAPYPELTVKFSLFNDTREAAVANYIFVNTLAPNNTWLQYGLVQQAPSLYDVKVAGQQRMFACMANVQVNNKGVFRSVPQSFIEDLLKSHGNEIFFGAGFEKVTLAKDFFDNDVIRIPDVYEVTIAFKSLFPENVNNYLYRYAVNGKLVPDRGDSLSTNVGESYYKGAFGNLDEMVNNYKDAEKAYNKVREKAGQLENKIKNIFLPNGKG